MKLGVCLIGLLGLAVADQDGVLWNFGATETVSEDLGELVGAGKPESPLLVFLLPSLALADFSRAADVYAAQPNSLIPNIKASMVKSSGYFGSRLSGDVGEALESAGEVLYYTPEDANQVGSSPVIVLEAATFADLDAKAADVLAAVGSSYRALLVGKDAEPPAHLRSKRDAPAAPAASPPAGTFYSGKACIAVMGNVTVVEFEGGSSSGSRMVLTPAQTADLTKCNVTGNPASWNLTSQMIFTFNGAKNLELTMNFETSWAQGWTLVGLIAKLGDRSPVSLTPVNLMTLYMSGKVGEGRSYACTQTEPIVFLKTVSGATDKFERDFAIQLHNFQVAPFAQNVTAFGRGANVDDCTPFFTPGIWMSIFSLIILALTLIFGLAMISSLKTMDRFDDPKGKPLNINAKD